MKDAPPVTKSKKIKSHLHLMRITDLTYRNIDTIALVLIDILDLFSACLFFPWPPSHYNISLLLCSCFLQQKAAELSGEMEFMAGSVALGCGCGGVHSVQGMRVVEGWLRNVLYHEIQSKEVWSRSWCFLSSFTLFLEYSFCNLVEICICNISFITTLNFSSFSAQISSSSLHLWMIL